MPSAITIRRETPDQADVLTCVRQLDAYNDVLYPPEANHFLDLSALAADDADFLVARSVDGTIAGIGALKAYAASASEPAYGEVKRMFVLPEHRGQGIARLLLHELEAGGRRRQLDILRLETGTLSIPALLAYERFGFRRRGAFGTYPDHPLSVFMEKLL